MSKPKKKIIPNELYENRPRLVQGGIKLFSHYTK